MLSKQKNEIGVSSAPVVAHLGGGRYGQTGTLRRGALRPSRRCDPRARPALGRVEHAPRAAIDPYGGSEYTIIVRALTNGRGSYQAVTPSGR